ncbi:hypothetical protein LSH36_99g07032 [Paralvinella palmiformis]|uniref:Uncharacterized protein n=1 Tax=Paralvinella palmiformis TaxID=53620 RepID=A0AAD9K107_9ANNE|nr:hypothetical protein LSH36_99g07032 [Paralvinella palmiformis]
MYRGILERPSDASRRRTTQVVHVMPEGSVGPRPVSQDSRMMAPRDEEDSPTGTFTRGGRLRSSLPVVRSPNKSLERPMGELMAWH